MQDPSLILSRFLAMARALGGPMDYQSALQGFADELASLIRHDHLDITLLANQGRDHVCYEVGLHTFWSTLAASPMPVSCSPVREVLWGRVPHLLTDDALVDPRFHFEGAIDRPIFEANLQSRVIVPLRVQGTIIGSLAISRHQPGCYDLDDVTCAEHGGDILAPYMHALAQGEQARRAAVAESETRARAEMLRLGALRLTQGMEQERQRLGMDLHDQTLADLSRLSRRIARFGHKRQIGWDALAPIQAELDICLHELRRIIEDTKPGVLQLFGFADAVEAYLHRSVDGLKPAIRVRVVDRSDGVVDRIPETIRTPLYRIVQEAINNSVKHSGAGAVEVAIEGGPDEVRIEIADDGTGLAPEIVETAGGIGNMRTRAALISARLDFRRSGVGGTRVVITTKLTRHEPPAERAAPAEAPLAVAEAMS